MSGLFDVVFLLCMRSMLIICLAMSRDGGLPERKDPSNLLYDVIPPDLKALELKRVDVELKRKSPSRDQDMFPQELQ
jgi:hypothetical protein